MNLHMFNAQATNNTALHAISMRVLHYFLTVIENNVRVLFTAPKKLKIGNLFFANLSILMIRKN